MTETSGIRLTRGSVDAVLLPAEGAVLTQLRIDGRSVLATTPWAPNMQSGAAQTEDDWVQRWRGGWQLCFPSAGAVDDESPWPQGFHGVASQAPWSVVSADESQVTVQWQDEHSLTATRTWRLTDVGARVETVVHNGSGMPRPLVIAEHLVLGGDLLAPVLEQGVELSITPPPGALLAPLDYAGHPQGAAVAWPGPGEERWPHVDRETPARVGALVDVDPRVIHVDGAHARAVVTWHGLAHALIWEELAQSAEPPWNKSVIALGIEPTSAPHGMGTALAAGTIALAPGDSLSWHVELAVEWTNTHLEET